MRSFSLADSQVLRWLDELNGITDAEVRAKEIKMEIRRLRKEQNSVQNRRRIKQLYAQLDTIQFKPDYLCVIIDKEKTITVPAVDSALTVSSISGSWGRMAASRMRRLSLSANGTQMKSAGVSTMAAIWKKRWCLPSWKLITH